MIMHYLKALQDWFSNPIDGYGGPPPVRKPDGKVLPFGLVNHVAADLGMTPPADVPVGDGRAFMWIRARHLPAGCYPTIIRDKTIGPKLEIIGDKHELLPHEYDDDIEALIARYPVSKFARDWEA